MTPPLPPNSLLSDRWQLAEYLGGGAMGEVWRGRHAVLGHEVAVKLMRAEAARDPQLAARFLREARIAAQLRHRNLVRVEDFGTAPDGRPYLVMELLLGTSLGALLAQGTRLDRAAAVRVVHHVGTACDVAHAAGFVHRDLKPDNCFVTTDEDGAPLVKVLDFGVAKLVDSVMLTSGGVVTASHALLGTPLYMSPEQARGQPDIDGRSDLWSLAVMAYELLTGGLPYEAPTIAQLLYAVLAGPIPPPSSVDPTLGPAVDAWCQRALERDRARRFQSGRELAAALAQSLGIARPTPSVLPPIQSLGLDASSQRPRGATPAGSLPVGPAGALAFGSTAVVPPPAPPSVHPAPLASQPGAFSAQPFPPPSAYGTHASSPPSAPARPASLPPTAMHEAFTVPLAAATPVPAAGAPTPLPRTEPIPIPPQFAALAQPYVSAPAPAPAPAPAAGYATFTPVSVAIPPAPAPFVRGPMVPSRRVRLLPVAAGVLAGALATAAIVRWLAPPHHRRTPPVGEPVVIAPPLTPLPLTPVVGQTANAPPANAFVTDAALPTSHEAPLGARPSASEHRAVAPVGAHERRDGGTATTAPAGTRSGSAQDHGGDGAGVQRPTHPEYDPAEP